MKCIKLLLAFLLVAILANTGWSQCPPTGTDTEAPTVTCAEFAMTFDDCPDGLGANTPDGNWITVGPTEGINNAVGGSYGMFLDLSTCVTDNCTALADMEYTLTDSYTENVVPGCSIDIINEFSIRDASGNVSPNVITFRGTIAFTGTTPPVIVCPANVGVECGNSTDPAATGMATATSDCGDPVLTYVDAFAPACGTTGIITRTWTATTGCGETSSCDQIITTFDTQLPVLPAAPAPTTVECDAIPMPEALMATDACAGMIMGVAADVTTPGACDYSYTITRTWTFTDDCGNSDELSQEITVEDTTPPVVTCAEFSETFDRCPDPLGPNTPSGNWIAVPASGTFLTAVGGSSIGTIDLNNCVTDNCSDFASGGFEYMVSDSYEENRVPGCSVDIINEFMIRDICGNVSPVKFIFRGMIQFGGPAPVIVCPANATVECGAPTDPAATGMATATSDCGNPTIAFTDTSVPGCGLTEVISRTWTATDGCGTVSACTQTITIVDTTPPVIVCPANATVECGNPTDPGATGNATATDGCGGVTVAFTDASVPGCGDTETISRTWTATDDCGNMSVCTQTITVEDTTPPDVTCAEFTETFIGCPDPIGPNTPSGNWIAVPANGMIATAVGGIYVYTMDVSNCLSDGCGDDLEYMISDSYEENRVPGCSVDIINEFMIRDDCGNVSPDIFNFRGTIQFDGPAPVITCPANLTVECDASTDPADTGMATATSDCGVPAIAFTDVSTQGQACAAYSYMITRTWTATDGCGTVSVCTQIITVEDTNPPVITCPANVTVECDQPTDPGATGNATASNDNCAPDGELTVVFSDVSTQTPTGCGNDSYTITRTWTATDPCGNATNCVQVITVEDTTPPTIICPANATIECDEDTSPANNGMAVAVDNCAPAAEIVIAFSDVSTQGTTGCAQYQYTITRTWTATDPCGNATNCVQVIEVEDTTTPEIVCPADLSLSCTDSTDPADTGIATGSDNCSDVDEVEITSSDISTQGTEGCSKFTYNILRTWTATDACGNTTTCVQSIDVADTEAPVITCPPSQTLTCFETLPAPATNAADFIALGGTISDNCTTLLTDFTVFTQNDDNGGDNCPGNAREVVRTYFVLDACGNATTCTQTFTYLASTQGPVITSVLPSCFKYCASLANPMESDITYDTDCSFGATVNITGPVNIGQENCPGSIARYTYTVTDDCGRTSAPVTRDFIIQNDGPTIECPTFNLLLECGDPNNSDYIAAHAGLVTANSSCDADVTINYFPQNFNNITCNTSTVVTFVATDACGRTASCTTTVNISDNTAPEITSVYEDGICNEAVCGSNLNFWYNEWKDKVLEGLSATDACDTNVSFSTQGPNSPNQNCPDETTETVVNFVATDNCGNTSYIPYSFYVTALDTPEPPQASNIEGMIHTEEMEAVEDVEVTLTGGLNFFEQFVTANDGNYAFNNVPLEQNYSITPYSNQFPMNGVSSFDLVLIAQHILNVSQLDSPYKIIAADVNRSGSVTTFDLVELRKMILMIETEFSNNTSWRFVDANFVFPNATNPFATAFPEIVDVNGLLESVQQDFVGVKIGDVNGSVIPNTLTGGDDRSFNGDLPFNVQDVEMEAGETYEVAFTSSEFEAIMGYQYTLNFDTDLLEFVEVRGGDLVGMSEANFGLSLLNEGAITTSWTNNNPLRVNEDEALYYVTFTAKRTTFLSEALSINSRYTKAEAYDVSTENGQLNLLNVALRFDDALSTNFSLMQNTPNPFSNETVIGFILPEATFATMTVYDVSGRALKSISGNYEAGYNEVSLDRGELKSGMMYYTLTTSDRTLSKKMLLIDKK